MSSDNGYRLLTDKLRQRGQDFIALLRDPVDRGNLQRLGSHTLINPNSGVAYTIVDGVVRLAAPNRLLALDQVTQAHANRLSAQGWLAPNIEEFRRLPQTALPTWSEEYWATRAAVIAEMWRILEHIRIAEERLPIGPMGLAADLSDGMGWVGYGLDVSGYNTVVVSPYNGPYGLNVFPFSRYLRVQADISAPPLVANAFDLVVVSFSLPEAPSATELLANAARLIKPEGLVMILSTEDVDIPMFTEQLEQAGLNVAAQRVGALGSGLGRAFKNLLQRGPAVPPILLGRYKL